jgi:hypothetical protein
MLQLDAKYLPPTSSVLFRNKFPKTQPITRFNMKTAFTLKNILCVVVLAAIIILSWNWPGWRNPAHLEKSVWLAQLCWGLVAIGLTIFLMLISTGITKHPLGFLINERNLMSLARFQTVLWTIIILSAYLVIAMARLVMNVPNPLEVAIDVKIWALLSISLTSLVGTSLINSTKTDKTPAPKEISKTASALAANNNLPSDATAASAVSVIKDNNQGTLYANPSVTDARFSDMFEGDEVGNAAYVDIAKVQMFFFTIVVAISYIFLLLTDTLAKLATTANPETINALPVLSSGMIALLGISHAGNLAGKGVNRTATQPTP